MSRLLRGVFCVIETFHKYANKDGDNKATLTCRELRQLLEGEIRNFLEPRVFHAVERKLNLPDIDRDGTISFEEFLLKIFSLLNLFYFDISLLNSETRLISKSEKVDAVDFGTITGSSQQVVGVGSTQEKLTFSSEMASSVQLSNEEGEADEHTKMSPWEGIKTHNLSREASEPNDPENQEPEEDSQEAAQDGPAKEYDEVPKRSSSPTQELPRERGKPSRRQSDIKISDHMAQKSSEDEECASSIHEPFLQREDKAGSEPVEAATGIPSQTQEFFEPIDDTRISETREPGNDDSKTSPETTNLEEPKADNRTPETHGLPAQERKLETRKQSIQSESNTASETSSTGKWEEGQKEHERKTRPPAPETQIQDENCQEFPGSWRKNSAEKGSGVQNPSSEDGNQNLPEVKEESISGKEARHDKEDTADEFAINRKTPAAEETLQSRERSQELAPLEKQPQGKNHTATRTHDKPVRREDHIEEEEPELSVTQSDEGSYETPNSLAPEVSNSSSEIDELHELGDSSSQVDPYGDSKLGSHNNNPDPQNWGAPHESSRVQEEVALSTQEDRQLPEEQE